VIRIVVACPICTWEREFGDYAGRFGRDVARVASARQQVTTCGLSHASAQEVARIIVSFTAHVTEFDTFTEHLRASRHGLPPQGDPDGPQWPHNQLCDSLMILC
jgi:hypothetical protein